MHSNCCAIFPTWPKCPARWLRTQMYMSYAREVRSSMHWLIGPQSSIMLCEQQVLGETWRWPRLYMTLTHTDQRWQHEYLVRWVIVFAVQFQFQQSCFAEQTAFALRLQFSNAKWSLIVQHFFQNFVFAGTASGNQDVSATEGSVNKCLRQYTHMVLKKKHHAPQLWLAQHVCLIMCVVFSLRSAMAANRPSKQHTYSCLGNEFPHTYRHTVVTHWQQVVGEGIWNVLPKPTSTVKFLLVTTLTCRHFPATVTCTCGIHCSITNEQAWFIAQHLSSVDWHTVTSHIFRDKRVFPFCFCARARESAHRMKEERSTSNLFYRMRRYYVAVQ